MTFRLPWIVFFLSAALLGYQLVLMRILSYIHWQHFAVVVISIALLGFGASGTLLTLKRDFFLKHEAGATWMFSFLCAIGICGSHFLLPALNFDPYLILWKPLGFFSLVGFALVFLVPFFCGAFVVGFSFVLFPQRAGRLYFYNLLGSGLGSLLAILLMEEIEPVRLPAAVALFALPAPLLASLNLGRTRIISLLFPVAITALLAFIPPPSLPISQYKGLSKSLLLPGAKITARKTGPLGVVETLESPALRYAPGLSLGYAGTIPTQIGTFMDGEWIGTILDVRDSAALDFLDHSTSALPFHLKKFDRVLVVGSGTGTEIELALSKGVPRITGIEQSRDLVEILDNEYREHTNNITRQSNVHLVVSEARSYLRRDRASYDLIVVPILEGLVTSASGGHALFENYLFTVEAVRLMLDHLADRGVLVMSGWMTSPPRGSVRTLALLVEAMRQQGFHDPSLSLAGIRSWGTFSYLVKRGEFTAEEIKAIRLFCSERGFDLIYVPGIWSNEVNRFHLQEQPFQYEASVAFLKGDEENYFGRYLFNVRPASDNQPYFSHFFRWKSLPQLMQLYSAGQIAYFELGYVLLIITLVVLTILSFGLIVLPLIWRRGILSGGLKRTALYFGGIGMGYMMIEILLIQKFILFLGHPVYSVAIITASLLIFSGVGSLVSQRIQGRLTLRPPHALGVVVLCTLLYAFLLSPLLSFLLQLDFPWRVLMCVVLIVPLAFLMGFPFPLGLQWITSGSEKLVPWAWGINGYCSVISSGLAVLISVEWGFFVLFLVAMFFYAVALLAHKPLISTV